MNIVFRTDSSALIGSGHLMRCLTLADTLAESGAKVTFLCREHEGSLSELVCDKGYTLIKLACPNEDNKVREPRDEYDTWLAVTQDWEKTEVLEKLSSVDESIDWLVVDHYALDSDWESSMRPFADRIMVIDDLANRSHDCDILLDQSHFIEADDRYANLVSESCTRLLGPNYALLRNEFTVAREGMQIRECGLKRILVFLGGADMTNDTEKALDAIASLESAEIHTDVVIGGSNPHAESIRGKCKGIANTECFVDVSNMAELMARADVAIGAAGTTTWERCCVGLPSLVIAIAENQEEIGREAGQAGVAYYLGQRQMVRAEKIAENIEFFMDHPAQLRAMSRRGMELVDGRGASRVSRILSMNVHEGATV